MGGRFAIRRLRLSGLAPRDHPSPDDLAARLGDAARTALAEALSHAADGLCGAAVLRIRRLDIDVSMMDAFDPAAFAALLARAIVAALRQAEEAGSAETDGVMAYQTRAAYVAALIEALAVGRAMDCWWLRDAEGLRFLSRPAAIRTALLADPRVGVEALASLPPVRFASLLSVLGPVEAERVLDGFAAASAGAASADACIAAIAEVSADPAMLSSPLALYLRVWARRPGDVGPPLAEAARLWASTASVLEPRYKGRASAERQGAADVLATVPEPTRLALTRHLAERHALAASRSDSAPTPLFSAFGGLLLLLPTFPTAEIAETAATRDNATLIAFAALGLCAGRRRFGAWLEELPWRELFGLDLQVPSTSLVERLAAISDAEWAALAPLGEALSHPRDARFLILPRDLAGSRAGGRALAGLARAASGRFARRLAGFGGASAQFLWENLLGSGAALRRGPDEWEARLDRPPLDVLLSLSRIAEGSIALPSGIRVRIARVAA